MAANYAELKRRVQLMLDRDDANAQVAFDNQTVDVLDQFINWAENRFYRSEAARTPPFEFEVKYTIGPGTGYAELAIPTGYYETSFLLASDSDEGGNQVTLARTSKENILNVDTSVSYGFPDNFAYSENMWLVKRYGANVFIRAIYYAALPNLSTQTTDTTSHWLLNHGEDIIVYWAASYGADYFGSIDPAMAQRWEDRGNAIHDAIVEQEIRQKQSGSTPRQKRPYFNY